MKKDDIILLGSCKGASAALYFGIKFNYKNIVCSAPQIKIYDFLSNAKRYDIISHMTNFTDAKKLNSIIIDAIIETNSLDKNIYLFSSPTNEYDKYEVHDLTHRYLCKFNNFNHIITKSFCVQRHNQITKYNIPLITSILQLITQNFYPHFGEWFYNMIEDSSDEYTNEILTRQKKSLTLESLMTKFRFEDGKFFPEGYAFIRGYPSPKYTSFSKNIIFEPISDKKIYKFSVGSLASKSYSFDFFQGTYCDYNTVGFASLKRQGILLNSLSIGKYKILIEVCGLNIKLSSILNINNTECSGCDSDHIYYIYRFNKETILCVMPSISSIKSDKFLLTKKSIANNTIHYEGIMIKYGIESVNWHDINVWLILKNKYKNSSYTFYYGMLNIKNLNKEFDGLGIYQKSNFCSIGKKGINIRHLEDGDYYVFITMQKKCISFSELIDKIKISTSTFSGNRIVESLNY